MSLTERRPGVGRQAAVLPFRAHVVGGALTHELGGSTDLAGWIPLTEIGNLSRVELAEVARTLAGLTPSSV